MLVLTEEAAEVVRELIAAAPIDDDGGLRISFAAAQPEPHTLELTLVETPDVTDEAVKTEGAQIFLESEVAEFLDDKILDVEARSDGIQFTVRDQIGFDSTSNGHPPP